MNYITYNKAGEIIGRGSTQTKVFASHRAKKAQQNEFLLEGKANPETQKIMFSGFDIKTHQPINPVIINKTPAEVAAYTPFDLPPDAPFEKQQARITNGQLQSILHRVNALEARPR